MKRKPQLFWLNCYRLILKTHQLALKIVIFKSILSGWIPKPPGGVWRRAPPGSPLPPLPFCLVIHFLPLQGASPRVCKDFIPHLAAELLSCLLSDLLLTAGGAWSQRLLLLLSLPALHSDLQIQDVGPGVRNASLLTLGPEEMIPVFSAV